MKKLVEGVLLGIYMAIGMALVGFAWSTIIPIFKKLAMVLKSIPV
jgi:hypothetical protein